MNNISQAEDASLKRVKSTKYGTQAWDYNSLVKTNDNLITIKTIFTPKDIQKETKKQPINYTMQINCETKEFRDLVVNDITNDHTSWHGDEGDKLINEIINDACSSQSLKEQT